MKNYYIYLAMLLIVNSFDKTLSVDNNLCAKNGKIRSTFAEIFGQEWKNEIKIENDQNSNWQNDQNDLNSAIFIGSDQNNDQLNDEQKIEIVHKFHAIKEGIKKRGKYLAKFWIKIEEKIAKKLGINRTKIYKWKKELKMNKKNYYENKKKEFIERIDKIKRMSKNGKQKQFVKEFGIGKTIFMKWKKEFGIEIGKSANRYSNEEKTAKMNFYYKMKKENLSLADKEIAEFLKIGINTLIRWKKQND